MLEVLDTAGQEEYIALRDQWIRDGEGFVLVYSISSRSSFARIQKFHHQIQRVKENSLSSSPTYPGSPISASHLSGNFGPAPVMLVGNKCDRVTEREVSTQEGSALAKDLGCDFVEASAKNCVNVEKAFYEVVRQLRRQRHQSAGGRPEKPIKDRSRGGYGGGRTQSNYNNGSDTGRGTTKYRNGDRTRGKGPKEKPKCVIL
jgi:GTPase KRas protein